MKSSLSAWVADASTGHKASRLLTLQPDLQEIQRMQEKSRGDSCCEAGQSIFEWGIGQEGRFLLGGHAGWRDQKVSSRLDAAVALHLSSPLRPLPPLSWLLD